MHYGDASNLIQTSVLFYVLRAPSPLGQGAGVVLGVAMSRNGLLKCFIVLAAAAYLIFVFAGVGIAQTLQPSGAVPSSLVAPPPDPSNPLGFPRGTYLGQPRGDTVNLSSGLFQDLFPRIPNLEFGFNYSFGSNLRQSRWSIDYLLPVAFGNNNTFFAEAHGESVSLKSFTWVPFLNNFWQQTPPGAESRVDLSLGIGFRRIFGEDLLLGVNAFYDTTRLYGTSWRSSGGYGLEMAANGPGNSAFDLTFNYYGNVYGGYNSRGSVFPTFNIVDGIQSGQANYDLEAGYSQPIFEQAFDLRLKVTAYQFALNDTKNYGMKSGAELTTADGVFRLSVEGGHDPIMGSYGNVGGYVNVGFQLEKMLYGESPFSHPEPVFKSPRNFQRLLARPVHRLWVKPATVVANANCQGLPDDSMFYVGNNMSCFYTGFPVAADECHARGRLLVSDTPGGKWVNSYDAAWPWLFSPFSTYVENIQPMDKCQSAAYARAAQGDVLIFVKCGNDPEHNPNSVLWTTELPTLLENPNVTSIKAYDNCGCPPPDTWCHEVIYR